MGVEYQKGYGGKKDNETFGNDTVNRLILPFALRYLFGKWFQAKTREALYLYQVIASLVMIEI